MKTKDAPPLVLTYTNYRGETGVRRIIPLAAPWWGQTDWHPEPQWLLRVFDVDKQTEREFALKDFAAPPVTDATEAEPVAWQWRYVVDLTSTRWIGDFASEQEARQAAEAEAKPCYEIETRSAALRTSAPEPADASGMMPLDRDAGGTKIPPEALKAWVDYEAPVLKVPFTALKDAVMLRHAFLSGWRARRAQPAGPDGGTVSEAEVEAVWRHILPLVWRHILPLAEVSQSDVRAALEAARKATPHPAAKHG